MKTTETELLIIGGGPGGYTAAFEAASRGIKVALVDQTAKIGGACLHHGCIPSKAYLHATEQIEATREAETFGLRFAAPEVDIKAMREWKDATVNKLADGLDALCDSNKIKRMTGRAIFQDNHRIRLETEEGQEQITLEQAIIATGSGPAMPEAFDLGNRAIMTSREALDLDSIPARMLVIGGGYIGLEMGSVYARLGASVSLVEAADSLLPGLDNDLVKPVRQMAESSFYSVRCNTEVKEMHTDGDRISASIQSHDNDNEEQEHFDKVLVAVGRKPKTEGLGLETTEVDLDKNGYISTSYKQQTSVEHIYAIGDVTGGQMLAHRAFQQAHRAVDTICGNTVLSDELLAPAVVYTNPEIAWVGLTETEASNRNKSVLVGRCSWNALGRAHSLNCTNGLTKIICDAESQRILGLGIVGKQAGEFIAEGALAIELAATAEDIAETIHPHPSLSESLKKAARQILGKG